MRSPSRRRVLGSATATTTALLSGCLGFGGGGPVPGGHIFVENAVGERTRVALSVTRTSGDDEQLVNHVFAVPASHALEFTDVLEQGETYEIRALMPEVPQEGMDSLSLELDTCDENDSANRLDVSILLRNNGPDIVTYGCDEVYERKSELTYVDRNEYEVGTFTETIPTSTPS